MNQMAAGVSYPVCRDQWFLFLENSHVTKMWKNTFPKEFFNEILLKVREHEYVDIFEVKFENKNILFKNGGQNKFWDIVTCNNADLC